VQLIPGKIAAAALWLGAAVAGAWWLHHYEGTAGGAGRTPSHWPTESRVKHSNTRATLLFFAHPKCPCSRASVEELNRLMARANGRIEARALFLQPENCAGDWSQGSLWNSAAAIPGVLAQADEGGIEARRFGAETSGFVVLYSPSGELLFHGGITAGRGHAGDNAGSDAILSVISGDAPVRNETPVFGCSLFDQCTATAAGCDTSGKDSSVATQ
jgi:hypothetical protein